MPLLSEVLVLTIVGEGVDVSALVPRRGKRQQTLRIRGASGRLILRNYLNTMTSLFCPNFY